jgi:CDP-2,3-bis-(O-geranylgeranyl)-sn-glycerol synthase
MALLPADPLATLAATIWLLIPAYVPNSAAVLAGGRGLMDFGRSLGDGERVLGDGKTWSGFFGGSAIGIVVGGVQQLIASSVPADPYIPLFHPEWPVALLIIATLAFGGMTGDAVGSFVKRRLGIRSGGEAGLLDQLPFALMAWWFLIVLFTGFYLEHFANVVSVLTVLILTPLVHRGVNILGYRMGKKKVPW